MSHDTFAFLTMVANRHELHQVVDQLTQDGQAILILRNPAGETMFSTWGPMTPDIQAQMLGDAYATSIQERDEAA